MIEDKDDTDDQVHKEDKYEEEVEEGGGRARCRRQQGELRGADQVKRRRGG